MDIELLSKMIKELLLDNEEVTLPGLGTFVSELVPSSFSDKGYTINPPYRRLVFRQRNEPDSMLAGFYAASNGTDRLSAEKIVSDFAAELKKTLQAKKVVVLPGLGRLRATKENAFFFIPDEDLDIYPYGYGLEPVSLKTHEETPEEVSVAVAGLAAIMETPAPELVPISEVSAASLPGEGGGVPVPADGKAVPIPDERKVEAVAVAHRGGRRRGWKVALVALASLMGAAILFLGAFVLLSRLAPGFMDTILYSPEELQIINH